ncbi:tetratricopeptide repeat protein [Actinosynnema sp. NPDC023794]
MSDSGFVLRRRDLALPESTVSLTEITARADRAPRFELFRLLVRLLVDRDGMVLPSGPVDWRELRERHPDTARWHEASRPADLAASLGPRFSCVRLDDLFRDGHEDFVTVDEHGVVVTRAQRLRRLPTGRPLFIRFPAHFPVVIGSDEAIRRLVPAELSPNVHRARDTRVDYAAFHHLWHGPPPAEYFGVDDLLRSRDEWNSLFLACGMGKALGRRHAKAILDGEARDFVGTLLDDATPVDDEHEITLVPEPTDAQCAADVAPLLPTMNRARWLSFRAGYLYRRPAGLGVLDLMEHGNATGWAQAARDGDWDAARARADAQLTDGPPDPRLAEARHRTARKTLVDPPTIREDELALNVARALTLTGRDDEAAALCRRVVAERTARLGADHPDTRDAASLAPGDAPRPKRRWWRL